jgi:hypothetical protein
MFGGFLPIIESVDFLWEIAEISHSSDSPQSNNVSVLLDHSAFTASENSSTKNQSGIACGPSRGSR